MSKKSLRDRTRVNFTLNKSLLTLDEINTGANLRIADAFEKISLDRVKLEDDCKFYKDQMILFRERSHKKDKTISSLRGHITILKNKLEHEKAKNN